MRRFIAMLVSVFLSIFNNTPYTVKEKPAFRAGVSYSISSEDAYTPQETLQKMEGSSNTHGAPPDATEVQSVTVAGLKSPKAGQTLSTEALSDTVLTWTEDDINIDKTVIMPETATVADDSSKGNGGHELTLTSGQYTFVFKNLFCRYPEMSQGAVMSSEQIQELTGKTISTGQVVGVAQIGTTLEIYKDGKAITLNEYFK